jgi:hypothetical protein
VAITSKDQIETPMEPASDKKSNDSDMVTLITTMQQIMTGLKTAETEDDRFVLNMRAVYEIVMKK